MIAKPPDYLDLYGDGRHYDLQVAGRDLQDIPYYLKQVERFGDPVLELACGTGRLTLPLARQGYRITGLDVSAPMLEQARVKAAQQDLTIRWIHADCRDYDLGETFATIIFPYNSFLHLHDRDSIEATFARIRRHLAKSGRFMMDTFNPNLRLLLRDPGQRETFASYQDPDGRGTVTMSETGDYDRASQVNHIKWYFSLDSGVEWVSELNIRILFPQELNALLYYNGLEIEEKYGDFDGSPFTSGSPKQVIVAKLR